MIDLGRFLPPDTDDALGIDVGHQAELVFKVAASALLPNTNYPGRMSASPASAGRDA
ncbi:MAG TPA: hypothetical protein VJL54_04915 [Nitrososphaera sp.]|nr:hypothetical protein [Nitrososphaera sp.]